MSSGTRIAVAVGVGYLIGRRRKLRTALTLAAAVALGRASREPGGLTRWGGDLLRNSPQLANLGQLGKPLASAGRAAATAAAGSGVDALSGKLRGSADALRRRGGTDEPAHENATGPEDEAAEDEYADDQDTEAQPSEASESEEPDRAAPDSAASGSKTRRRKR